MNHHPRTDNWSGHISLHTPVHTAWNTQPPTVDVIHRRSSQARHKAVQRSLGGYTHSPPSKQLATRRQRSKAAHPEPHDQGEHGEESSSWAADYVAEPEPTCSVEVSDDWPCSSVARAYTAAGCNGCCGTPSGSI
jgi:hypothetical protein